MMTLKNDTTLIARSIGHFDFYSMNLEGTITSKHPTRINTTTGLVLNCHPAMKPDEVSRLAAIARNTPDYPVDLCAWTGPEGNRRMVWNARIYWRKMK